MSHVYWVIPVAVPAEDMISLNGRAHFMAVHRQTVSLAERGYFAVKAMPHPTFEHAACQVLVRYPDHHVRRDVANYMGTIKPIIDGMVRARLLPDDDDTHLEGPDLRKWTHGDYPEIDDKCGRVFLQLAPTMRWFRMAFCFDGQGHW